MGVSALIGFDSLWAYAAAKSKGDQQTVDSLLSATLEQVAALVGATGQRQFELKIIPPDWYESGLVWSEGDRFVCVGLALLRKLDDACLAFADQLTSIYRMQQSSMGPSLPLSLLVGARDFPEKALQL